MAKFRYRLTAMAFVNNGLRHAGYEFTHESEEPLKASHIELIGEESEDSEPAAKRELKGSHYAKHTSQGNYVVLDGSNTVKAEYAATSVKGEAKAKAEAEAARLNEIEASGLGQFSSVDDSDGLPDA